MTWTQNDDTHWTWQENRGQFLMRKGDTDIYVELATDWLVPYKTTEPGVHDAEWPLNVVTWCGWIRIIPGGPPATDDACKQVLEDFIVTVPDDGSQPPENPPGGED